MKRLKKQVAKEIDLLEQHSPRGVITNLQSPDGSRAARFSLSRLRTRQLAAVMRMTNQTINELIEKAVREKLARDDRTHRGAELERTQPAEFIRLEEDGSWSMSVEICPGCVWGIDGDDLPPELLAGILKEAGRLGLAPVAVLSRAFVRVCRRYVNVKLGPLIVPHEEGN